MRLKRGSWSVRAKRLLVAMIAFLYMRVFGLNTEGGYVWAHKQQGGNVKLTIRTGCRVAKVGIHMGEIATSSGNAVELSLSQ